MPAHPVTWDSDSQQKWVPMSTVEVGSIIAAKNWKQLKYLSITAKYWATQLFKQQQQEEAKDYIYIGITHRENYSYTKQSGWIWHTEWAGEQKQEHMLHDSKTDSERDQDETLGKVHWQGKGQATGSLLGLWKWFTSWPGVSGYTVCHVLMQRFTVLYTSDVCSLLYVIYNKNTLANACWSIFVHLLTLCFMSISLQVSTGERYKYPE